MPPAAQQFDPALFIYPNADTEANVFIASWARHMTLGKRPSVFSVNLAGGNVDVDVDTSNRAARVSAPGCRTR